jgi:N-acetylglucosamine-6-phosphate deacetylase
MTRHLHAAGVTVMLGHSATTLDAAEQCMRAGASGITHLYNAMHPYHHRDPNLIGLLASDCVSAANICVHVCTLIAGVARTIFFGLIADGEHVHDSAMRIAWRTNGDGLVCVQCAHTQTRAGARIRCMLRTRRRRRSSHDRQTTY